MAGPYEASKLLTHIKMPQRVNGILEMRGLGQTDTRVTFSKTPLTAVNLDVWLQLAVCPWVGYEGPALLGISLATHSRHSALL